MGSNLYDRYIKRLHARTGNQINGTVSAETTSKDPDHDPELADSRNMPPGTKFHKQTVKDFMGLLVCTGEHPKFYIRSILDLFPSLLQLMFSQAWNQLSTFKGLQNLSSYTTTSNFFRLFKIETLAALEF